MATSAGLVVHRRAAAGLEVLLAHPGGPLWHARDAGAWSIPKGLMTPGEAPLAAALREFEEETGLAPPPGPFVALTPIRQKGGKQVLAWAVEADLDLGDFKPGLFEMAWPPRSGRLQAFPEIDRIQYFQVAEALSRILPAQAPLIAQVSGPQSVAG